MSARHHSRGFEDRANARPPTIQIASSVSRRMLNNRRIDLVPPRPSKLPRIQNKHHLQAIYGHQYGPNLLESLMNKGDRIIRSFVLTKLLEKWPDATPAQRDRTLRSLTSPNAIYGLISSYQFEIMQQHASKVALTGTEIVDIFLGLIGAAYYKGPAATQQWLRGLFGEKLGGLS